MQILTALVVVVLALQEARAESQHEILSPYVTRQLAPSEVAVILTRTCGLGCVTYRVTISADGSVKYEGLKYVKIRGEEFGQIASKQAIAFINELLRLRFFDAPDAYAGLDEVTLHDGKIRVGGGVPADAVPIRLALRVGEAKKAVRFYPSDPLGLQDIADEIDAAVGIEQWIGAPCERPRPPFMPPHSAECAKGAER